MASTELARTTSPYGRAEGPAGAADELQEMFPALERAVIESALRQHCGAMEVTVDYLVALTQGDTARLLQPPPPSADLGGPARYMEVTTQDTLEAGRDGRVAKGRPFFAGKKTTLGSKYSRRLFGAQKAAVSSDGLDLHLELQEEDNDGGDGAVYDHSDGSKPVSVAAKLARQLSLSKRQGSTSAPATSARHQLLSAGSDEDELGPTQGYHKLEGGGAS